MALMPLLSCNKIKETNSIKSSEKIKIDTSISDSLAFEQELIKIRFKAKKKTVAEKVFLRNNLNLICSKDLSLDIKKIAYKNLVKHENSFDGYFKNNKFDTVALKAIEKQYEESIDELEFAKEFKKFSDSINAQSILNE